MTTVKKIVLCALTLATLAGAAHAAAPAPAPAPLSRADMTDIRGEGFIDYGALNKNRASCSHNGNCSPGGSANPYQRGCSAANRCSRH